MGSYLGIPRRRKKVFCKLRWHFSAENICLKFLFQLEGWLYNSHPPRIGSPAAPAYDTSVGIAVQSTAIP